MTPKGQIAKFRVYPEPRSRLHFGVRVFSSNRALRVYLKTSPIPRVLGHYGRAMCSTWQRVSVTRDGERLLPDMGEILLTQEWIGTEVITHECTHAAVGWAERIRLMPLGKKVQRGDRRLASPSEERFCYGLGQMARQIVEQLYKRKLIVG